MKTRVPWLVYALAVLTALPVFAETWDGGDAGSENWSVNSNWVGDAAPANPTAGTITFGAGDAGNTNIVDADWQIGGLVYSDKHTTDLGGNTLTVGDITVSGNINPVIRNGVLSAGSAGDRATITVMTGDWVRPSLTLTSVTFNAYLDWIGVGMYRNGGGTLDLSAAVVNTEGGNNILHVEGNIDVGTGESSNGGLLLPTTLRSLRATGTLSLGQTFGQYGGGTLGCIETGSQLDEIVVGGGFQTTRNGILNIPSGVNMSVGSESARGYFRLGGGPWDADGVNFTLPGGALTGYLTDLTLVRSANQGWITLDLSTAESVDLDISGELTTGSGGTIKLPSGTVTAGTVTVGNSTLMVLSNTVCTVTNTAAGSATIGSSGELRTYVGSTSCGLDVWSTNANGLTIGASASIDFTFMEAPTNDAELAVAGDHDGIHYGLKWAGDHEAALTALLGTELTIDDTSHLTGEFNGAAGIFYDPETDATYVGFYTLVIPRGTTIKIR